MRSEEEKQTNPNLSLIKRGLWLLLLLAMVPLFFAAKGIFSTLAQSSDKTEKTLKKESFKDEPVEFISIESDGEQIMENQSFHRDDEWLKGLKFRFRNKSDKPIVYLSIALRFPQTSGQAPQVVHFLKYGINPLAQQKALEKSVPLKVEESAEQLPPGETDEVVLSTKSFAHLKDFLATRRQLSLLTEVEYQIMVVFFDDGTQWSAGTFARPDPANPGRFIPIEKSGGK
jgi:hypothetical protein